jgi:glycosyltransferase involved in cell wall biosynthesis
MNNIIFSIIIPHKNIPDLLQRCLSSIPKRDDIQIIVVDDNSDANRVDFNRFPGLGERYVEVYFTKEGKGAGYARNVGLKHAKGKWILFADADDFFTENAFKYLFAEVDSHHEIVYFKVASCYSDTYEPANRGRGENKYVDSFIKNKPYDYQNQLRYKHVAPWGKIIKKTLIDRKNITFDEVVAANDITFSLHTGHFALSINANHNEIYYITVKKGSITNTHSLENLISKYVVILRYNQFLREHGKKQYRKAIAMYLTPKYGIGVFFKLVKLAIQYKNNPFIGITRVKDFILICKENFK